MTAIINDSISNVSQNPVAYDDPPKSEKNDSVAKICAVIATIAITIFGLIASFLAVGIFAPVTLSFEAGLGLTLLGGAAIGTGGYFAAYHFFKWILKTPDDSDPPAPIEASNTENEKTDRNTSMAKATKDAQAIFDAACADERRWIDSNGGAIESLKKMNILPGPKYDEIMSEIQELEQKYKKELEEKKKQRQQLIDKYKTEGIEIDRSAEEQYSLD